MTRLVHSGHADDAAAARPAAVCRFCGASLVDTVVDLGMSPLCEKYIAPGDLGHQEPVYPLHLWICRSCLLVQLEAVVTPSALFDDYAYFSSYSDSWVAHARDYGEAVASRFTLGPRSVIVEVASNDGYLLQHFVARGLNVLGVEPAANVAAVAEARGIPTEVRYFGLDTAARIRRRAGAADLLVANNVLAHVPALNDFVAGLAHLLAPQGVLTLEFPHVVRLIQESQFDTIYHEHFSYFSLLTAERVLKSHGLSVFDLEELGTHGGSLRLYVQHAATGPHRTTTRPDAVRQREHTLGFDELAPYLGFTDAVQTIARDLVGFLRDAHTAGKRVAGYGAPGKGNTLLNYCGIGSDLLEYTVDRNPHKQGLYTPGARIPIHHPDRIAETKPDFVLILPWNLKDEIVRQMAHVRTWGGRFVVPIPSLQMLE